MKKNTLLHDSKTFCFCLFCAILFFGKIPVHANSLAYADQISFTINMHNQTLKNAIDYVEKNSEFIFIYHRNEVDLNKKISINLNNGSIQQVLDAIFNDGDITYTVKDRQIIIHKAEKPAPSPQPATTTRQQQRIVAQGVVTDAGGESLVGVNILEKGTTNGTITDIDGGYKLEVSSLNAVLVFSYIGYETQEVALRGNPNHNVKMQEDTGTLDEVVVVGYGVQKKVNLSGAVQAVSGETLASRPITNVGSGLQGTVPNLNITVGSGRADDAPILNIRGFTSINDKDGEAFVLVDNVPVSKEELARINPDDIESVSVLKDASAAAIYGARAAFGVILITTKAAKTGELTINFSGNYAIRDKGITPSIVTDVETVVNMKNLARYPLTPPAYNQALVDYSKQLTANPNLDRIITDPGNPNKWAYLGETDWMNEVYKNSAPTYTANINISKKTETLSYYVSGGYYQQDGLLKYGNDKMRRYNFRAKSDIKLTNWWKAGANISYTNVDYDSPSFLDGYFYWQVNRTASTAIPRNPDGTWSEAGASLLGALESGGRRNDRTNETQVSITTQFDIIKNVWTVNADANFRRSNKNRDQSNIGVPSRSGPNEPIVTTFGERSGDANDKVANIRFRTWEYQYNVYNVYTNFNKTFNKKHYFNAMLGYNRELTKDYEYEMIRKGLITEALPEINLSTGEMITKNSRNELALEGVFGRLNYIFDNKYIVEFNGRYDGSSRFPKGDRWGFFPSASAAWSVINESFFENVANKLSVSNLKIRGSYGVLGNQVIKNDGSTIYYPSIPYMGAEQLSYILDGIQPSMVKQPGVVSKTLTWEKVRTVNVGVDLGLFNKFDLSFDFFNRYTDDMLTQSKELPAVFGADPPKTNAADLKTTGWELSASYRDRFFLKDSPFNWSVRFMIADSKTKITKYDNPTKNFGKNGDGYYEGKVIGEIWGLTNDGFFRTQEEIDALDQRQIGTDDVGYIFLVGDVKYKDLDGDDKITFGDNTVDKPGDRKIIGNTTARFPYSFELSADWKGFDIRAFFQGVGKRDWYPGNASIYFWGIYAQPWTNVTKKNMDHWTESNPNAYFPRIKAYAAEDQQQELAAPQTKYLQDASYLRMKNLTIGYSLPKSVLKKMHISHLRFYFSAENLFTISNLDKDIDLDPEIIDKYNGFNSGTYPMQRTYSIGANLTF